MEVSVIEEETLKEGQIIYYIQKLSMMGWVADRQLENRTPNRK